MTISIVIPDLDSPLIDRTLAALREQGAPGPGVEVLVVGSDAPGRVPRDGAVRLLATAERLNPAAARNRGVAAARGQRLLFTDADCRPAVGWVRQLAAALDDAPVAGGAGAQDPIVVFAGRQALVERSDTLPGITSHRQVQAAERTAGVGLGRTVAEERVERGDVVGQRPEALIAVGAVGAVGALGP